MPKNLPTNRPGHGPRLTSAKCQRAMDAVVALIETHRLTPDQVRALDEACNAIRKIRHAVEGSLPTPR